MKLKLDFNLQYLKGNIDMKKKKLLIIIILVMGISLLYGCRAVDKKESGKIRIITTLFPQYDFARQLAGDKAEVILLIKPGVETHDYEPTPNDIIKINQSDLLIYTGKYMEPWAQTIIDSLDNKELYILDASTNIDLFFNEDNHEDDHNDDHGDDHDDDHDDHESEEEHHSIDDGHNHEYDPHIWTDPINAKVMVDNIVEALSVIDEANSDFYKSNGESYKNELDELDRQFRQVVEEGKRTKIIFGGRFALSYFVERYDIDYVGAYESCAANEDPSIKQISNIVQIIKQEKIPVIYYEELVDPKVAKTIAEETKIKTLLLHSVHNVSKKELEKGVTYLDLMRQNVENLREGLR